MKKQTGGCHCGQVTYEAELELDTALVCNCSICTKRGLWLGFIPESKFTLLTGKENLQDYTFNKHVLHHFFCKTCGVGSFTRGTAPDGSPVVALNLRCIDGVDLSQLKIQHFDGRKL